MQSIRVLWKHLCLSSCEATLTKDAPAEEELVEEAPAPEADAGGPEMVACDLTPPEATATDLAGCLVHCLAAWLSDFQTVWLSACPA